MPTAPTAMAAMAPAVTCTHRCPMRRSRSRSTSIVATTRRARSPHSRPARCHRRKIASTSRSQRARRLTPSRRTDHRKQPIRRTSMRLLSSLLLSAAIASGGVIAHAATPQASSQAATLTAAKAAPVPLLWKVSDADNSLYLLGSFHMLKPDDYPVSADIDAAFDDAESLLFEIDPAAMTSPDTIAKFQQPSAY